MITKSNPKSGRKRSLGLYVAQVMVNFLYKWVAICVLTQDNHAELDTLDAVEYRIRELTAMHMNAKSPKERQWLKKMLGELDTSIKWIDARLRQIDRLLDLHRKEVVFPRWRRR